MVYVTSGICGNYNAYKKLIGTINLRKRDDLYVIGDIIGPCGESFALLEDMSMRENVFPVLGNNEFQALKLMKKISDDEGKLRAEQSLPSDAAEWLVRLLENFRLMNNDTRSWIIEYVSEMALYEELTVDGHDYLLVSNETSDFSTEIHTENKEIITGTTPPFGSSESMDRRKLSAVCLNTGEEYHI